MKQDSEVNEALTQFHDQYMKVPRDATFPSLTRPEGFNVYAHAYWLAADKLFRAYWVSDESAPTPDYLVMPVLFLLHHYIELELKEIIRMSFWVGNEEDKPVQDLPTKGRHILTKLLQIAEGNLKEIYPEETPLLDENSKNIIEDLEDFGSRGEGLRYPETNPEKGSKPTISPGYIADVRAVMTAMKQVRRRFNGCIGWLHDYQQNYLSLGEDLI